MQVTNNISLDLIQSAVPVTIYAKQYDQDTRYIYATLTANGSVFTIPAGTVGVIKIAKPDGTYCFYDSDEADNPAVIISGNVVQIRLVSAALSAAGLALAEVNLYNAAAEKLTSFAFNIQIQVSTVPDGAISTTYVNILTALIAQAITAAQSATASATLSESWAVGGTETRTGEDTNNAKYWSEQAEASVVGAVKSVNTALPDPSGNVTLDAADIGAQPEITANGILKGDGSNVSVAIAGTDYQAPTNALLPAGGSAGSVLAKAGASDYAAGWINTLPIANGGTGAADQAAALSALLGASAVPITNGGTGATTAAAARSALGFGLFQFLERKWVSSSTVLTLDTQMQGSLPVIYVLTLMQLSSGVYSPFVYIINHRENSGITVTNVSQVTQTGGSFGGTTYTIAEYNTNQLQITASAATYFSASLFAITSYQ